jgi:multiple sugar transport system permease protein
MLSAPTKARSKPKRARPTRRQPLIAYLLLSPALVLYIAFVGIPVVGIVVISFVQWDLISPPHFVGFANYRHLVHDNQLGRTLANTFLGWASPWESRQYGRVSSVTGRGLPS